MISIKTKEEIATLKEGGAILAHILDVLKKEVNVDVPSIQIEESVRRICKEKKVTPSFLNYASVGEKPYPAAICISINDEIVHSFAKKDKIFKEGDVVKLDMGIIYKKMFLDSAITFGVGKIDAKAEKLIKVTEDVMYKAIDAVRPGVRTGDIGQVIEDYVKPKGFSLLVELGGHGVGYAVHEEPFIPNFGKAGEGPILKEGMVICIEPMVNEGKAEIFVDKDGLTFKTKDGKRAAHFEHTIAVTDSGSEILTKR